MAKISRRTFLRRTVIGAGGAALMFTGFGRARAAGPEAYRLRIIHSNDTHARIEPTTGITIRSTPTPALTRDFGGVSRRKTIIDAIRTEGGNQLLLDAGDIFQGTLWFNQYKGIADLAFFRQMGYDAMTLGNHEFDLGQAPLAKFIRGANGADAVIDGITLGGTDIPVLSANITIDASSPLSGLIQPRIIKTIGGEQIGIFGLTTQDTAVISSPGTGVTFTDPIAAAQAQVTALKAAGVNKIIALSHIGYDLDIQLASQVEDIDIIVGGHSHTPLRPAGDTRPLGVTAAGVYPTVVTANGKDTLIVTAWEWGKWLGDISVGFDAAGLVIADSSLVVNLRPVWAGGLGSPARALIAGEEAPIAEDAGFVALIDSLKGPITALQSSRVADTAVKLDADRPNIRNRETNLGNLVADSMLNKARTLDPTVRLAITNGGGIRTSVNPGAVTVGKIIEILPFGNTIARADLTAAQLKEALENGVSQVNLANPTNSAGRFPQVAGIRFSWNTAAAVGERVTDIQIAQGSGWVPLDLSNTTALYRVVTNNFMLAGGDGYTSIQAGINKVDLAFDMALVLEEEITARSSGGTVALNVGTDARILRVASFMPVLALGA